jgi:chromate transporter
VVVIGALYTRYGGLPVVQAMFYGVGAAVIGIIAVASARLSRRLIKKDRLLWAIFSVLALSTALTGKENVVLFIGAGVLTLLLRGKLHWPRTGVGALSAFALATPAAPGEVFRIFVFFAKAGLFVFGSGLAMVPFLQAGVVQEHRWLTERQFLDAVAVAMITPGPVVITVAFIGYLVAGVSGAFAAAAGVFLPVYIVVMLLAPFYSRCARNSAVRAFVAGVTAAAMGALAGAVVVLGTRSIRDPLTASIAVLSAVGLWRWRIPEPGLIVAAAALGVLFRGAP